jgi:hypothetical protein
MDIEIRRLTPDLAEDYVSEANPVIYIIVLGENPNV